MLRHTKDIRGFKLDASDGELGKVKEFLIDDLVWRVRYLIADTGRWIPGRLVLISPTSLGVADEKSKTITVNLAKDTIKKSPSIVTDRPVSRQNEIMLADYYGWPTYWEKVTRESAGDPTLRSSKEIIGYDVVALDSPAGKIDNIIIDDLSWDVRYMIVDTKKIGQGRKVLIALEWVTLIDEKEKKILVDVPQDMINDAPIYSPEKPINRAIEAELFDYYKKKYYWEDEIHG